MKMFRFDNDNDWPLMIRSEFETLNVSFLVMLNNITMLWECLYVCVCVCTRKKPFHEKTKDDFDVQNSRLPSTIVNVCLVLFKFHFLFTFFWQNSIPYSFHSMNFLNFMVINVNMWYWLSNLHHFICVSGRIHTVGTLQLWFYFLLLFGEMSSSFSKFMIMIISFFRMMKSENHWKESENVFLFDKQQVSLLCVEGENHDLWIWIWDDDTHDMIIIIMNEYDENGAITIGRTQKGRTQNGRTQNGRKQKGRKRG